MFWKRKLKVQPAVLADGLIAEFIEKPLYELAPEKQISSEARMALNSKLKLYQSACVLLAVLNEENKNAAYSPVREHLEKNFFPATFAQGANMLDEVRCAMRDLDELFTPKDKQNPMSFSWARKWFSTVGIDESNPVTLSLFVFNWTEHFIAIKKAFKRFIISP
jgi:hypothetical protein